MELEKEKEVEPESEESESDELDTSDYVNKFKLIYPNEDHNTFTYSKYIDHAKALYNMFTGSGGAKRSFAKPIPGISQN